MVDVDFTLWIQIANFLFLVWALNTVFYKPIRKVLLQRKENIRKLEQGIDAGNKGAEEKDKTYTDGLREARIKAIKQKDAMLNEAAEEEKKIIEKINAKAQADLVQVREQISKDADGVRKSLMGEMDQFVELIGQKILGRAI